MNCHAISRKKDLKALQDRRGDTNTQYTNEEEKRVIQGSETKTAKANGEISENKTQSRYSHGGSNVKHVKVENSTSTKIIKEYE